MRPGAMLLCRESTVADAIQTRRGDYQVVYRPPDTYSRLFKSCGLSAVATTPNIPYIFAQMVCEMVKRWKAVLPRKVQCLPVVGRMLYWTLRLGYPWNARFIPWVFSRLGKRFPALTNHFFLMRVPPSSLTHPRRRLGAAGIGPAA